MINRSVGGTKGGVRPPHEVQSLRIAKNVYTIIRVSGIKQVYSPLHITFVSNCTVNLTKNHLEQLHTCLIIAVSFVVYKHHETLFLKIFHKITKHVD